MGGTILIFLTIKQGRQKGWEVAIRENGAKVPDPLCSPNLLPLLCPGTVFLPLPRAVPSPAERPLLPWRALRATHYVQANHSISQGSALVVRPRRVSKATRVTWEALYKWILKSFLPSQQSLRDLSCHQEENINLPAVTAVLPVWLLLLPCSKSKLREK